MPRISAADLTRMNEKNAKAGARFKGFAPGDPEGVALNSEDADFETRWPLGTLMESARIRLGIGEKAGWFLRRELDRIPEKDWRSGKPESLVSDFGYDVLPETIEGYVDKLIMAGLVHKRLDKALIEEDRMVGEVWVSFAPLGARFVYFAVVAANHEAETDARLAAMKRDREEKRLRRKLIGR